MVFKFLSKIVLPNLEKVSTTTKQCLYCWNDACSFCPPLSELACMKKRFPHSHKLYSSSTVIFHQQRIYPAPSLTKYPKWNSISPPKFMDIVPKSHHLLLSGELLEQRQRQWCSIEKPGFTRWIFLSRRIRACFMRVERDECVVMRN